MPLTGKDKLIQVDSCGEYEPKKKKKEENVEFHLNKLLVMSFLMGTNFWNCREEVTVHA